MKVIGLTGCIGMGKSVAARQWRFLGIPVHDADAVVHQLLAPNGAAFPLVKAAFPTVVKNGFIDRKALGELIFKDNEKRHKLEDIMHPLVRESADDFLALCRRRRVRICVLDIPLLFEIGRERDVHEVMCVTAPHWVQKRRVLSRPSMNEEKFRAIAKTQIPDYRKKTLSDHVVITARGRRHTLNAIKKIKNKLVHE